MRRAEINRSDTVTKFPILRIPVERKPGENQTRDMKQEESLAVKIPRLTLETDPLATLKAKETRDHRSPSESGKRGVWKLSHLPQ